MGSTGDSILLVLCLAVTFLALAVGVRLVIAARRIRWHSVPLSSSNRTTKVTVIVPARNEEQDLAATLESILKQADVTLEVIVIDDHSTDRTGMIADAAARADPRVQVIHHPPLPPGWLGKSNAMHQAVARASGEYLLFTDADILYQPACLATALAEMEQHQLDFLSLFPQSGADAFWGPTKNVLSGLHGRTWLAPLLLLWPLVVFWTPVVSIVAGAWESHPAVLLAGFAAYAAEYATLWPSRSLFRFHPVKALFFPLAVISVWCCLLRALYHYLARGSIVWRGRAVKVR